MSDHVHGVSELFHFDDGPKIVASAEGNQREEQLTALIPVASATMAIGSRLLGRMCDRLPSGRELHADRNPGHHNLVVATLQRSLATILAELLELPRTTR